MILGINWLAVLVAAIATFVLGGLWYGPLFGRIWRAAEGQTEPPAKQRFALFAVDAGCNIVLFALMGLIIGLFG
jgi:hypothetical protein